MLNLPRQPQAFVRSASKLIHFACKQLIKDRTDHEVILNNAINFSFSSSRKLKGPGIPTTSLRCAPDSCDVYVVARDRIVSKLADLSYSHSSGMIEVLAF